MIEVQWVACGNVAPAHVHAPACHLLCGMCRETKRSKGVAYVQFQIPEDAVKAAQQLDGTIFQVGSGQRGPGSQGVG